MTKVADTLASFVEKLGGEWTRTDTCAISFHDAIDVSYFIRSYTQSRAGTCADGVGRRHERIAAKVHVEHGSLSTFAEDALTLTQETIDLVLAIDNLELLHVFNAFHPQAFNIRDVVVRIAKFLQALFVKCLVGLVFSFEIIQDVAHAKTVAANLIGIGRTDTLARRTHLVLALGSLNGGIEQAMGRHDEVSLLRYVKTRLQFVSAAFQFTSLLHEKIRSQHNAVADDVDLSSLENA